MALLSQPCDSTDGDRLCKRWKGKKRDEGTGASNGIVLSLSMVGDGTYDAVYTVPVTVGTDNQKFSLQVDTGSSDLWLASTSCSSAACTSNKPQLYNPSSSVPTGQSFNISYLSGQVSGPIVWDKVVVGGYEIDAQALSPATSVANEPLAPGYSGILGLALPLNSVIAQIISPGTSNAPDGATFASNLFGITPASQAPAHSFYSLALDRPGSSKVAPVLGIGRHPAALVPDPSKITYSDVVAENVGTLYWKVELRALTVYVNGTARSVDLSRSASGRAFPEAVLDSGVPRIIATPRLASGIWGALGIAPAADGNYYLPCTTPLNMTITLDDQSEIPLHPLDLSAPPLGSPSSETCQGLIQETTLLDTPQSVGDIILGVPFLRNVYTVMSYEVPDAAGVISDADARLRARGSGPITPRLGLLSLTDPATALADFDRVRVQLLPLEQGGAAQGGSTVPVADGRRLSVGIEVLIGLLGFFALAAALFLARWLVLRRRWAGDADADGARGRTDTKEPVGGDGGAYALADRKSPLGDGGYALAARRSRSRGSSEGTQKTPPRRAFLDIGATFDSGRTHVGGEDDEEGWADGELGFQSKKDAGWDAHGDTLVAKPADVHSPTEGLFHARSLSDIASGGPPAVAVPLLSRTASDSPTDDFGELGMGMGMAGIGTVQRGSLIDAGFGAGMRHVSMGSVSSVSSGGSSRSRPDRQPTGSRRPSTVLFADTEDVDDLPPPPDDDDIR